ncbi:hypothetical protein CUMW_137620 [Citrus unshiu]|uniref:Cytochrome P450 n=1 Tax=Citrus unshiu TaxID=55188 RepID=A0A2H5PHN4_CITUN|nr:hypothetical protein CUMW_137620 [Citrus unshiu]
MGFSHHLQEIVAFYAFIFSIICVYVATSIAKRNKKGGRKPPEAAGAWPCVGHLHLLAGSNQLIHRTLGKMADKYGRAFLIHLGIHRALVISSWELMGYDHAIIGFAPYGSYWREVRKLSTAQLLSNHRLELLKHVRDTEVKVFIKELHEQCAKNGGHVAVEMKERFKDLAMNIIVRMVAGKRYYGLFLASDNIPFLGWLDTVKGYTGQMKRTAKELDDVFGRLVHEHRHKRLNGSINKDEEDFIDVMLSVMDDGKTSPEDADTVIKATCLDSRQCQKALGNFFYLVGLLLPSDNIPFLGWLDVVNGYTGQMKKTAKELDTLFGRLVYEHRHKRLNKSIKEEEKDFIDVMVSVLDDGKTSAEDADTVIKSTCLSLILGGNDTTVVTLTWALSLLLNNHHVLKKAQDELSIHVGNNRQVEESDIKNLIYLQAIVKETLRLYPALPLSAPREAMEDCIIGGFHIPAGTRLIVNLWKMHHDPSI